MAASSGPGAACSRWRKLVRCGGADGRAGVTTGGGRQLSAGGVCARSAASEASGGTSCSSAAWKA
eukprot:scaffold600_cov385-Prasinococcus_capsulatus_cf.AAC.24